MAQPGVAHFVRISSQLDLSFILNQITNHLTYRPVVIVYQKQERAKQTGLDLLAAMKIPVMFLCDEKDFFNRAWYFLFRKITGFQKKRILRFLNENNIGILHFHFGNDAGMFLPVIHHSGYPSVVSFYGDDCTGFPKKYFGLGLYWLRLRVFSKATRIFAMSPEMKKSLTVLGCPEKKITVHYFGAETTRFQGLSRSYTTSPVSARLLIIANLVEKKGHLFLFHALKLLSEKGTAGFYLTVIGSGVLEPGLKAFARDNGLDGNIRFIRRVDYLSDDFVRLYRDSDIFILPSITGKKGEKEGIPGVLAEAMATGLPVISTFHAGIPSVIENGKTGILVHEWDIPELLQALESLIVDPSKREMLGKAGQKFAVDTLDIASKEKELEDLYSEIQNG